MADLSLDGGRAATQNDLPNDRKPAFQINAHDDVVNLRPGTRGPDSVGPRAANEPDIRHTSPPLYIVNDDR